MKMGTDDRFVAWAAGVADGRMTVKPSRAKGKSGKWGYGLVVGLYGISKEVKKAWEVVMDVTLTARGGNSWYLAAKDQDRVLKMLLPYMQNDADVRRGLEFRKLRVGKDGNKKPTLFVLWKEVRRVTIKKGIRRVSGAKEV